MADDTRGLDELRARLEAEAGAPGSADAEALAGAAAAAVADVLELIAAGRGVREAGSGLNPASTQLLVADALLTEAAARAATSGVGLEPVLRALRLEELSERAHAIDGGS